MARNTQQSETPIKMLVFEERGKLEYPEKNLFCSKDENQQQTQPTFDTEPGNQTRATLVGGLPLEINLTGLTSLSPFPL